MPVQANSHKTSALSIFAEVQRRLSILDKDMQVDFMDDTESWECAIDGDNSIILSFPPNGTVELWTVSLEFEDDLLISLDDYVAKLRGNDDFQILNVDYEDGNVQLAFKHGTYDPNDPTSVDNMVQEVGRLR